MECCQNKNITCKNYENICLNCGTIHDYQYVNEISYRDYNMNMSNILFYERSIYKRKKYLYNICLNVKEINENIISFFDESLEDIRILYKMKRISISKYLNSIYYFYCNKSLINYVYVVSKTCCCFHVSYNIYEFIIMFISNISCNIKTIYSIIFFEIWIRN